MKKGFFRFMSYLSVFTLGIYASETKHGNTPEAHRWVLTILFGLFFL